MNFLEYQRQRAEAKSMKDAGIKVLQTGQEIGGEEGFNLINAATSLIMHAKNRLLKSEEVLLSSEPPKK
jgi:hypothetical protein